MRVAAFVVVLSLLPASAEAAERVYDPEHGFEFTVPGGFVEAPEDETPPVLHAYRRGKPSEGSIGMMSIIALQGPIGRERLKREDLEKAMIAAQGAELSGFDYRQVKWKSYELDLMLTWNGQGEVRGLVLTVQVPLEKQALQVELAGFATDEARLTQELGTFLASLDGRSSWETDGSENDLGDAREDEERDAKSRALRWLIGGGCVLLLVTASLMAWKERPRRGPR